MSRTLAGFVALSLGLLVAGCAGYRQGSLSHPDLQTVAVGEIRNASDSPHLATYLRQHLTEQLTADGSLHLVPIDEADCIIVAELKEYGVTGIAESRVPSTREELRINRTTAFRSDVTVNWRLELADASRPLLPARQTIGRGVYPERFDAVQDRESGLKQATHDAARQIVTEVTEGW